MCGLISDVCVCAHVCGYVTMCMYLRAWVYVHVCMCVHMYMCTRMCVYGQETIITMHFTTRKMHTLLQVATLKLNIFYLLVIFTIATCLFDPLMYAYI